MAAYYFEQVKKNNSHFADFEQGAIVAEPWMTASWMAAPVLSSLQNSLTFCFTGCLSIQFFGSFPFSQHSQAAFGYLPLTVQHLRNLRGAMPHHWSPSASHPALT